MVFDRRVPTAALSTSFARSALTSALATGTDFVLATALVASIASPVWATFFGCVAGGLVAFFVNRSWAFRARGHAAPQLLRFSGVWASSALLNPLGVSLVLPWSGTSFTLAWIVVRGIVYSIWNYPMLRWFVFPRQRGSEPSGEQSPRAD